MSPAADSRASGRLTRAFYDRSTLDVARELLGCEIVFDSPDGTLSARIVEVEAYIGENDPACHASAGRTARTALMFGRPGYAYIYFIYGMYYCLNFVTEREGLPAAVLLRAAEPLEGLDVMRSNATLQRDSRLLAGPGKFCRAYGLTIEQNGWDLTSSPLYVRHGSTPVLRMGTSPRVGIRKAVRRHWRFFDADSLSVSKLPANGIRKRADTSGDREDRTSQRKQHV